MLIDAPEGAAEFCSGKKLSLLVLTHGHFDHVMDAARIMREHGCPCLVGADSRHLIEDPGLLLRIGLPFEFEPVRGATIQKEGRGQNLLGELFDVLEVPGHCPGSLCFYHPTSGHLFGGDVLFCGGIGRTDLPGGDEALLLRGIREKLYTLPDSTVVHPGHGPDTTIGREKAQNPFVRG